MFAISACGLNVILGLAGQLSLAHAGFFGIGAYAVALLATKAGVSFWLGLPAGIALCARVRLRRRIDLPAQQRPLLRDLHDGGRDHHSSRHPEMGIADARAHRRDRHSRSRPDWPDQFRFDHRALVSGAVLPGRDRGGDVAAGALTGRPHADGGARKRAAGGGGRSGRDGGQAPGLHDLGGAGRAGRRPLRRLHRLSWARIRERRDDVQHAALRDGRRHRFALRSDRRHLHRLRAVAGARGAAAVPDGDLRPGAGAVDPLHAGRPRRRDALADAAAA